MKVVKYVLIFFVVLIVAALGIGFAADPKMVVKNEYVIDAPVAKVWAVISDRNQVKSWMPDHGNADEKIVDVKAPSALELAARASEDAAKTGNVHAEKLTRHTYVHANGTETTVEVEKYEPNKTYAEKVVADTTGMAKMFPEMHWGFEMAEAEGGKTKLTPFMWGTAAKPHGTLMSKFAAMTGMNDKFQAQMAKNIEALAQKQK
jgi:uncharacterized protein YndB with AHSA1/START domain